MQFQENVSFIVGKERLIRPGPSKIKLVGRPIDGGCNVGDGELGLRRHEVNDRLKVKG
jgi:hypothetical protein